MIMVLTSQREVMLRSPVSPEQTGEAVRRANASLWALQTSLPTRAWQAPLDNAEVLRTVTRASGGRRDERLTWLIEPNAVPLARVMLSQYLVTSTLPAEAGPGLLRVGVAREGVNVYAPGWVTARRPAGR
jgi:hypothetical protein